MRLGWNQNTLLLPVKWNVYKQGKLINMTTNPFEDGMKAKCWNLFDVKYVITSASRNWCIRNNRYCHKSLEKRYSWLVTSGFLLFFCSTKGVQGTIRYSGNGLHSKKEKKERCYIMQEDCLSPLFTVYEIMTHCGNLKLGPNFPEKAKQLLVSRYITDWITYGYHALLLCLNHRFPDFKYPAHPHFAGKIGRLLCDGTSLFWRGEVKGEFGIGLSHSSPDSSCQQRNENLSLIRVSAVRE